MLVAAVRRAAQLEELQEALLLIRLLALGEQQQTIDDGEERIGGDVVRAELTDQERGRLPGRPPP